MILFASLERKRGEDFGKKEEARGRNIKLWQGRGSFFLIIQNLHHLGDSKIVLE